MCDCITRVTEKVKEKKIADSQLKNYQIEDISFKNLSLILGDSDSRLEIGLPIEVEYTFEKKDGSRSAIKKQEVSMTATYCPFCGEKREPI